MFQNSMLPMTIENSRTVPPAKKVAFIGECMLELTGTAFGAMQEAYGGDTFNTAVYLLRCGGAALQTRYATALGDDATASIEAVLRDRGDTTLGGGDIAAELAWRDAEIERLLALTVCGCGDHFNDAFRGTCPNCIAAGKEAKP